MTRIEQASRRFYEALKPGAEWSYSNDTVIPLIKAAFALYAEDWSPAKIGQWEWPFNQLAKGGAFEGDQPWTILLRRAVEIARPREVADNRRDAMVRAESFIRGFEDDETQEGIADILAGLRKAIAVEQAGPDMIETKVETKDPFAEWWSKTGSCEWSAAGRDDLRKVFEAGRTVGFEAGLADNPRANPFDPESPLLATYRSAPDMLVALKDARALLRDFWPDDGAWVDDEHQAMNEARLATIDAAIAKAEG